VAGARCNSVQDAAAIDAETARNAHPFCANMNHDYVHGYGAGESQRLHDQSSALVDLLHGDTAYPPGSTVLEVGCGVGAQTVPLATRSAGARFTSIDTSAASIAEARRAVQSAGLTNVECQAGDLFALPFAAASFDHAFVCFVLEHLPNPEAALQRLGALVKPGGTVTVIEGDHGSVLFHPESAAARSAIACQVELQRRAGGDALIGRRLYPLLSGAGFARVRVDPRWAYADASRPAWVEGFTRKTFIAMVESVRAAAVAAGLTSPERFDEGVRDLHRTTEADGVFGYIFFKGVGTVR
jgi:SAM-dependent methyltransferase